MSRGALDFVVIGAQEGDMAAVARLLRGHCSIELTDSGPLSVRRAPRQTARPRGIVARNHMRGWHGTTTATIAARMALSLPDLKLVAVLRDPLERARLQHRVARSLGQETRSFAQAIRELLSADALAEGRFLPDAINTYIAQGEYGRILGEYLRYLPPSALHVELMSDVQRQPLAVRRRLLLFLGLPADPADGFTSRDRLARDAGTGPARDAGDAEPIGEDLRRILGDHYAADADLLHAITGLEVPWRSANRNQPDRRTAVYTAIAAGTDTLEPPEVDRGGCDFICFSDNPYLRSQGWQLRPLELLDGDPCRRALRPKVLAHRYLPEYAATVWVDANVSLCGDPSRVLDSLHGERRIGVSPVPRAEVIASHRRPAVDALREAWWSEIESTCKRDDLDLGAVLWRSGRSVWQLRGEDRNGPLARRRPRLSSLAAARIRREIETATTVLLSFPKAGRSWVSYFLARYVSEQSGGPVDLDVLPEGGEIPPIRVLHEHIDVFGNAPAPVRLLNGELLMQRRIIVLVRDPRDSLVSYWHHKRARQLRPVPARLELFADCPVYGIERISQSTHLLLDLYDRHPGEKLLVSYEELASDPGRRLREILRFALAGRPPNERSCRRALAASSFDRMRRWERALTPQEARRRFDDRFGSSDPSGEDGQFKVRRGQVGGFATELSPRLQDHVTSLPHTAALLERLGPVTSPRSDDRSAVRRA